MALEDEQSQQQSNRFKKFHSCETSKDPQSLPTLPPEIIFEILTRLPVESLLRCKSVCKSWHSLISDPQFIKSHLSLSASNKHYAHHRLVYITETRTTLNTCPLYDVLHDKIVNALHHGNPFDPRCSKPDFRISGSCNGLLCVRMMRETVVIWNPATRKWNRLGWGFKRAVGDLVYGFGYDESTDDYKVVGICSFIGYKNENKVRIYSLKTGLWKKIGKFPHDYPMKDSGKYWNGALHWAVSGPSYPWKIVSIDLADETFGEVSQPIYDEGYEGLALGVLNGCLCVFCYYDIDHSDVWVMKECEGKYSWTMLASIMYEDYAVGVQSSMPLFTTSDEKALLQLESLLFAIDSKNSSYSLVETFDRAFETNTFVGSLVSPCSPIKGKLRKRRIL